MAFDRLLSQTATKISIVRNEYGDIVYGSTESEACMYRDISSLQRYSAGEGIDIDGLLWLSKTSEVAKGDIYLLDGEYLRIERVVKAKDLLRSNTVQFIKCEVTKQRQIS